MNPLVISLIVILCCVAGGHLGMYIHTRLPDHHLTADAKETVKLGAGLVATMTALVLGLLVSSAKETLDTMNRELTQDGAKVILLDRSLAEYGQEAEPVRVLLRNNLDSVLKQYWGEDMSNEAILQTARGSHSIEQVQTQLRELKPVSDSQRQLQSQAIQIGSDLVQSRWLMIEQAQRELPKAFVVILLLWLTVLYVCYGLITPKNGTVRVVFLVSSISIAAAIFLIMEMNTPLSGVIKVSGKPLYQAQKVISR